MKSISIGRTVGCSLCLVVAAALGSACETGGSTSGQTDETTGTLSMPLTATTNGATYILVNASIFIEPTTCCGPYTNLSTGADAGTTDLTTALQTGNYDAYLEAWTLERQDPQGGFEPVVATLTSSSFQEFTIYNGVTTTVTFTFQTDGVTVVVGSGTLDIGIAVNESDAACTPLGNDCGPGSWCPPASLTGADLACVLSGTVALGQPCATPTDCVANASCFTLGDAGAVCAALCPGSGVNLPCPTGGICQSATPDYGICVAGATGDD
jgi:hypothetical protein